MSKKILHIAMAALLAIGGIGLYNNSEMTLSEEALAAAASGSTSAACTDQTSAAFVPAIAYTLTWSAPAAAVSALTPSCTVALSSAVNAEANPTCTATLLSTGFVIEHIQTPIMKVGGLQCQALGFTNLEVHGDGTSQAALAIAIGNLADSNTADIASGDRVDDNGSGAKAVMFGTSGLIQTTLLGDGSDNDSSAVNGELTFGGTVESAGGSEMKIKLDVSNYNVDAATDTESLTFTFTPSAS